MISSRAYILARTSRSPIPKRSAVCLRELIGVVTDFVIIVDRTRPAVNTLTSIAINPLTL